MKKVLAVYLVLMGMFSMVACGNKQTEFDIKIVVPAGSSGLFVYSQEEISPLKNSITIYSGDGLGDSEVVLKTVHVTEKRAYEPTYITPGMPVVMAVEKGAWFRIGVSVQNPTEEERTVSVTVKDVEVRIP